jgi:Bacterial Ig domain
MKLETKFLCVGLMMLSCGRASAADGLLIPATMPRGAVYDARHDIVYISEGMKVLRYRLGTNEFLPPIDLSAEGAYIYGLDLSGDETTLAVTNAPPVATTTLRFSLFDTDTLARTDRPFPVSPPAQEFGTREIAFASDDSVFTTSLAFTTGAMPLRRTMAGTGATSTILSIGDQSTIRASGDGNVIVFGQRLSDGRWGRYNISTGQLVTREFSQGTGGYVFDVALDRTGAQAAVLDPMGAHIYDASYALKGVIGERDSAPVGVAYHPVEPLAYFPIERTTLIRQYDMTNLGLVATYDAGFYFQELGRSPAGRTRLSRDGSLLMVLVDDGVRAIRTYDALSAPPVSRSTSPGQAVTFPLQGHLGIPGTLVVSLSGQPAHGTASFSGGQLTYTPQQGFVGVDTFAYQVRYGRAVATGAITVTMINSAPVAVNDVFSMGLNKAATIRVLDNDSDPDGDALTITSVVGTGPGSAAIVNNRVLYTPPAKTYGERAIFTYAVSDGRGGSASGQLAVALPTPYRQLPVPVRSPGLLSVPEPKPALTASPPTDISSRQPQHGRALMISTPVLHWFLGAAINRDNAGKRLSSVRKHRRLR